MKKRISLILVLLLWAVPAAAQQAAKTPGEGTAGGEVFDVDIQPGYRWVTPRGGVRAAEYEYLQNSAAGSADIEWDPLPHRFKLEGYYFNKEDFFGELDYAYRDVIMLNVTSRALFHNLDHYVLGPDDAATTSPSFVDRNPLDLYGFGNEMHRAYIRFKTPDFPFHLFAEARLVDRSGDAQQRFLREYAGYAIVSQSRKIDWTTKEVRVGANSHLGPIEAEYSHTEQRFEAAGDKALIDSYTAPVMDIPHNIAPDLQASSDTIKIHTSHTGRVVAAATYSSGVKKNNDSRAKNDYWNAAGDLTLVPWADVFIFLKYRHYDLTADNPDTVTAGDGSTVHVRDSISSQRDVLSGALSFRPTRQLAIKGEYVFESTLRDAYTGTDTLPSLPANASAYWQEPEHTLKGTAKLGASYRMLNKLTVRADYSHMTTDAPKYNVYLKNGPSNADAVRTSLIWTPIRMVSALLTYSGSREIRKGLEMPLAGGKRETLRNQTVASMTLTPTRSTSITLGYAFYNNDVATALTYQNGAGDKLVESEAPYDDTAHTGSVSVTQAITDATQLTLEASRTYARGKFANTGAATNTAGIADFSGLNVVESVVGASLGTRYSRNVGSEIRYHYTDYEDRIDDTQDGKAHVVLATMSLKW